MIAQFGKIRIYVLKARTENGCLQDCARMRTLGLNLATCYLAAWAEKAVKFELSNEKGREYQTKTRWEWSGRHNKNECGKCELRLNPDVRPCGEVKKP